MPRPLGGSEDCCLCSGVTDILCVPIPYGVLILYRLYSTQILRIDGACQSNFFPRDLLVNFCFLSFPGTVTTTYNLFKSLSSSLWLLNFLRSGFLQCEHITNSIQLEISMYYVIGTQLQRCVIAVVQDHSA